MILTLLALITWLWWYLPGFSTMKLLLPFTVNKYFMGRSLETEPISSYSSNFHWIVAAFYTDDTLLNQFLWWFSNDNFPILSFLWYLLIYLSLKEKFSLLCHSLIHLFIYLCIYLYQLLNSYIISNNPLLALFWCSNCLSFGQWGPSLVASYLPVICPYSKIM